MSDDSRECPGSTPDTVTVVSCLDRCKEFSTGIYSIWESRFPAETAGEGISVTKAIWQDMPSFDGYLAYELIQDLDQPGHLIVIGRWASREAADAAMSYASHPNASVPTNWSASLVVARSARRCDRRRAR